jgi:predicted small metal-binding protein
MKEFRCGDVIPLCDWHYASDSDEDLLAHVQEHAASAHGLRRVTPALLREVKSSIREVA